MSEATKSVPVWFWVVAGLALVWNGFGAMAFTGFVTMSPEALAEYPEAEQALLQSYPGWATIVYAIAVFSGVIGSLLLLLRKGLATIVFIASLLAIIVQFSYWLFMSGAAEVYEPAQLYAMPVAVIVIAVFLIWFSKMASRKGWIA